LPFENTELIPKLHDMDSVREDLDRLRRLFREDPELKRVRFSGRKIAEFVREAMNEGNWGEASLDDDEVEARREELVMRYLNEVEGADVLGDLGDALLKAGSRRGSGPDDFRCLATGLCLTDTMGADTSPSAVLNPLVSMLFWDSFKGFLNAQNEFRGVVDRLGGEESLRQRIREGESVSSSEIETAMEGMDLEALEAFREESESSIDELREMIREGAYPVGLPLASLLPSLVRFSLLDPEGQRSQDTVMDMVFASVKALGPEDMQLFDESLKELAQASQEEEDQETLGQIAMVRSWTAEGTLGPLDIDFVVAGLKFGRATVLDGEPELGRDESASLRELLSPSFLERYGDFLMDLGCPQMARRTWRLCELHGPLSPSVAEKLR
jgi:hypothetical protein